MPKKNTPERSINKKRKASSNTVLAKIKVDDKSRAGNPIVVSFPGGLPESVSDPKATNKRPNFIWQKLHEKASSARRVIGEDEHCTYSAHVEGTAGSDRRTKLCVGVFDKKRGIVTIREAAAKGNVFALAQTVPSYLQKNGTLSDDPGTNQKLDYLQVFEDFGSAKKRKVLKSRAANQVDIDNVVGAGDGSAVVQQILKGESMSESNRKAIKATKNSESAAQDAIESAYDAARRKFLPAYDENAVKPHKVYSGKAIAGNRAWTKIHKQVQTCMIKDDPAEAVLKTMFEKDWFPSIAKLVKSIPADAHDAANRYTCAVVLNSMIRFYVSNHKRRTIPALDESRRMWFGIPTEVASKCLEAFATRTVGDNGKSSHVMSKSDKDRNLVHALLLYLLAHGESMTVRDLKPIAEDMKVLSNDCGQVLRLAGCTILKKGNSLSAVLKTPLTFPPPKKRASTGRGRGR